MTTKTPTAPTGQDAILKEIEETAGAARQILEKDRTEKIERVYNMSDRWSQSVNEFNANAKKLKHKYWWEHRKYCLGIIVVLLVFLLIIFVVISLNLDDDED